MNAVNTAQKIIESLMVLTSNITDIERSMLDDVNALIALKAKQEHALFMAIENAKAAGFDFTDPSTKRVNAEYTRRMGIEMLGDTYDDMTAKIQELEYLNALDKITLSRMHRDYALLKGIMALLTNTNFLLLDIPDSLVYESIDEDEVPF